VLVVAEINASLGIGLETITGSSLFAEILNRCRNLCVKPRSVRERVNAHAVEMPAGQRAVVERFSVRANRDSIRAHSEPCGRLPRYPQLQISAPNTAGRSVGS